MVLQTTSADSHPANDNKNQNIHLNVSVDSSIGPTDIKKQISHNP